MKNNGSSEGGSQKVEHSRAKRKSSTETVAPVDCVFCREKEKGMSKMSTKTETVSEITSSRRAPHKISESLMCSMWSP